jgi:hypothetical protein
MKLQVRKFEQMLVLTDETGEMLPGQVSTIYESKTNSITTITVAFAVGPDVEFVGGEATSTRYER